MGGKTPNRSIFVRGSAVLIIGLMILAIAFAIPFFVLSRGTLDLAKALFCIGAALQVCSALITVRRSVSDMELGALRNEPVIAVNKNWILAELKAAKGEGWDIYAQAIAVLERESANVILVATALYNKLIAAGDNQIKALATVLVNKLFEPSPEEGATDAQ